MQPSNRTHSTSRTVGERSTKRPRTALACTTCRNRKTKCSGTRPQCISCQELNLRCLYEQPTANNTTPRHLASRNPSKEELQNINLNSSAIQDDRLLAELAPLHEVEDVVDGMASIAASGDTRSRFFGPSSNIAFLRYVLGATEKTIEETALECHVRPPSTAPASPGPSQYTKSWSPNLRVNIRLLPSDVEARRLILLFFSDTGTLFPFIHEQHILDFYNAAVGHVSGSVSRSELSLLNVIFAIATYISISPDSPMDENARKADVFLARARLLVSDTEHTAASLETVQALLLMTQHCTGTQRPDETWNLHGRAVRVAIQLGLHCKSIVPDPLQAEIRKRTWWQCYVLDRSLSMAFGRPLAISDECYKLSLPLNLGLQSLASECSALNECTGTGLFLATISLYRLCGEVLADLYDHNSSHEYDLVSDDLIVHVVKYERSLSDWQRGLSDDFRLRPWEQDPEITGDLLLSYRSSAILRLRFLNAQMLLHRPILCAFLKKQGIAMESVENSHLFRCAKQSIVTCRTSATEVIHIIHALSERPFLLGAWWFSAYYSEYGIHGRLADADSLAHSIHSMSYFIRLFDCHIPRIVELVRKSQRFELDLRYGKYPSSRRGHCLGAGKWCKISQKDASDCYQSGQRIRKLQWVCPIIPEVLYDFLQYQVRPATLRDQSLPLAEGDANLFLEQSTNGKSNLDFAPMLATNGLNSSLDATLCPGWLWEGGNFLEHLGDVESDLCNFLAL